MRKSTSFAFMCLLLSGSLCHAQVTAEVREETVLVFSSEPVEAAGLELLSSDGRLVPVPDPPGSSPFTFFLSNTPNQITWGNLGTTTTLEGAFNTRAGYSGDPAGDLTAAWGNGPVPVSIPVSLSGDPIPPDAGPPIVQPPIVNPPQPPAPGPQNPDAIFGEVREGQVLLFSSEPVSLSGIDLQSTAGNLVPVDDRIGAAPFTFFLANTPTQIVWGNLGSTVTLDGTLNTNAGYNGDPAGDLVGFWGDGPTPVSFPIAASNEPVPPGFQTPNLPPLPPQPPTPDPPIVNPPGPGGIPAPHDIPPSPRDGLVVGEIREDTIVVFSSEPVELSGLDFISQAGRLAPPENNDASPFMFFLSSTPNQVALGNLGTGVTIDGSLNTRIGYSGNPDGDLTGAWGDGPRPVSLPITVSGEPIPNDSPTTNPPAIPDPPPTVPDPPAIPSPPVVDPQPPAVGPLSGVVNDDGFVVLSASEPVTVAGIDLQSPAGNLVPVSEEVGPAPFAFFLSNTPNQITWGNLGTGVTLEGDFVTGAQYDGEPEGDLLAFWGDGPTPVVFAIGSAGADIPTVPGNEVIPEPSGGLLAWVALLGLLAIRRRRCA